MYYTTETACSCPDWQYRGRDRPCKHVRTAQDSARDRRDASGRHNAALQGPHRTHRDG